MNIYIQPSKNYHKYKLTKMTKNAIKYTIIALALVIPLIGIPQAQAVASLILWQSV